MLKTICGGETVSAAWKKWTWPCQSCGRSLHEFKPLGARKRHTGHMVAIGAHVGIEPGPTVQSARGAAIVLRRLSIGVGADSPPSAPVPIELAPGANGGPSCLYRPLSSQRHARCRAECAAYAYPARLPILASQARCVLPGAGQCPAKASLIGSVPALPPTGQRPTN